MKNYTKLFVVLGLALAVASALTLRAADKSTKSSCCAPGAACCTVGAPCCAE